MRSQTRYDEDTYLKWADIEYDRKRDEQLARETEEWYREQNELFDVLSDVPFGG